MAGRVQGTSTQTRDAARHMVSSARTVRGTSFARSPQQIRSTGAVRQAANRPSDMRTRRSIIARKPLITMHKPACLRPDLHLVRRTRVRTDKEAIGAIESTT